MARLPSHRRHALKVYGLVDCKKSPDKRNLTRETKDAENSLHVKFKDTTTKTFDDVESQLEHYCKALHEFAAPERGKINKGPYADGSIDKFERRIRLKISNSRFDFIFAFANSEAGARFSLASWRTR